MKRYLITNNLKKTIKDSGKSMRQISKSLNFEIKNIIYKNKTINEEHLQKLLSFLNLNLKLKEIDMHYEKNLGIYSASPNPRLAKRNVDLSEFIGIMLGDGNIWKNQLKISFDKRNKSYIKYVKELVRKIFNIELRLKTEKSMNTAYLYYYNKKFIENLIKFGLKRGHKIKNNVGIPEWIKENKNYAKRCIKGLIDTDGCIYICKREKQTYIKFTNFNKQLLDDFRELTKSLKYHFVKANKNNWCLYRKDEVANFIKYIKPFKSNGAMG